MLAIIDYGMGNVRSVQKAFERLGTEAVITSDRSRLDQADRIVLPGVGAIADAMAALKEYRLIDFIYKAVESGRPFLGICLGFQLLFDSSEENGHCGGLGLIPGQVVRFTPAAGLPVPHIGWNTLRFTEPRSPLFASLPDASYVYFVHSYYARCAEKSAVASVTDYGLDYCSAVTKGNLFGTQFHPEKSQGTGLAILKNFTQIQ